jgi:transposase
MAEPKLSNESFLCNRPAARLEHLQRPTMKFVATKTAEQLDLQALHRIRERPVSQRTSIINQIRVSCWSVALQSGKGSALYAPRCQTFSPRRRMSCHPAWCA